MFQKLVSHNEDIRRLVERGYAIAFDSEYLVVRDVPYLDVQRNLQIGAIVTKLIFIDQERVQQENHQIFFAGSTPHGLDGKPIPNLGEGSAQLALSDVSYDVVVERAFSNKPKGSAGFPNFYDKIESYVTIISGPAIELHDASPYTFRAVESIASNTIFKFHDTLTSRAEIIDLAAKFKDDVVAVIGLGGTGAYILDFLVKTPVREIRAFDHDVFHVHNAYRSPGRSEESEFGKTKAELYLRRYENFRNGLSLDPKFIDASSSAELQGVTFAFVSVDKGVSRAGIFDLLIAQRIPFIDVGMGLKRREAGGMLNGQVRTTYYSVATAQQVRDKQLAPLVDGADDIYRVNVQISELNALNAALAVIKFKQLRGFYLEDAPIYNLLFELRDLKIVGESDLSED